MVDSSHLCPTCQKSFSRQEHLRRHLIIHDTDRSFKCNTCGKRFSRKDTLRRHRLTHQNSTSLVQTKRRACIACVAAKARCSGDSPCDRCQHRGIQCQYRSMPDSTTRGRVGGRSPPEIIPEQTDEQSHTLSSMVIGNNATIATSRHQQIIQNHLTNSPTRPDFVDTAEHEIDQSAAEAGRQQTQAMSYSVIDFNSTFPSSSLTNGYWTSNSLSDINWLPNEAVNLDYAENHTLFPFMSSMDMAFQDTSFTTPAQQEHSVSDIYTMSPTSSSAPHSAVGALNTLDRSQTLTQGRHESMSISDAASTQGSTAVSGELYVDGSGARLPRVRRRRIVSCSARSSNTTNGYSLQWPNTLQSLSYKEIYVSDDQYQEMRRHHHNLCLESNHFSTFDNTGFLSKESICYLIENYLESFHPTMPFLHVPTFKGAKRHFVLLLSMAALGSHFIEGLDTELLRRSLVEFVRRLLSSLGEERHIARPDSVTLAQIRLLHSISLKQSSSPKFQASAPEPFQDCVTYYVAARHPPRFAFDVSDEASWHLWIQQEEERRTRFCIWYLDTVVASHAHGVRMLKLDTVSDVQLPCHEKSWEADCFENWSTMQDSHSRPPALHVALQNLYVDKRLLCDFGEFARIILIHALYHRTWDVQTYLQQGLSQFEPSVEKQSSEDIQLCLPIWHPDMALFNKWRNSACDCLDILHWSANASIGAASGIEHPTVLHLHFARVVLLSPLDQILGLARYFSGLGNSRPSRSHDRPSEAEADSDKKQIQQWTVHDQYKARLAAVHAGVSFWHVRRYSVNAFYEPEVIALSTLMLWAISAFSPKQLRPHQAAVQPTNSDLTNTLEQPSSDVCEIILLDRPTDDELVQQFVRQGHLMYPNMTGVGDLFGTAGPERVLREGRKLLETLGVWRDATVYWLDLLERLESVTAKASASIVSSSNGNSNITRSTTTAS